MTATAGRLWPALRRLSMAVSVIELGVAGRANELLTPVELSWFTGVFFAGLAVGVFVSPIVPVGSATRIAIGVSCSAVPILAIGLAAWERGPWLVPAMVACWSITGLAGGVTDPALSELATGHDLGAGPSTVKAISARFSGLFMTGLVNVAASALRIPAWVEFLGIAAVLFVALSQVRHLPQRHERGTIVWNPRLLVLGGYLAAAVLPTTLSFTWIPVVMRSFGVAPTVGYLVALGFVIAAIRGCDAWHSRSRARGVVRAAVAWLSVSSFGALMLIVAVLASRGSADVVWQWAAGVGFVLLPFGVAPLAAEILDAVRRLDTGGTDLARLSMVSFQQCLIVGAASFVLGGAAAAFGASTAVVGLLLVCLVVLFAGLALLRGPDESRRAS